MSDTDEAWMRWTREPLEHSRMCQLNTAWMAMPFKEAYEFELAKRPLSDLGVECSCFFDENSRLTAKVAELERELGTLKAAIRSIVGPLGTDGTLTPPRFRQQVIRETAQKLRAALSGGKG